MCVMQRAFTPIMHASENRDWATINAIDEFEEAEKKKDALPNQVSCSGFWFRG